jgi:hypothetical protein
MADTNICNANDFIQDMTYRPSDAVPWDVIVSAPSKKSANIAAHDDSNHDYYSMLPLPQITSRFETLDHDSIYLILVALCYTDVTRRLKQLWPLSLTCKRLRELCLPFMFKRVMWPNKRIPNTGEDIPMLPESLWPYIRYVSATSTHKEVTIDPAWF